MITALELLFGGMQLQVSLSATVIAVLLIILAIRRPRWELLLHAAGILLLLVVLWNVEANAWWLGAVAIGAILGTVMVPLRRSQTRLAWAEERREEMASQLDRRISELFSLQELSYVLSESIQLDRIVDQVVRYAARFLQSDAAVVVLQDPANPELLRVAAAGGSLEHLANRTVDPDNAGIVGLTLSRDRIEVSQGTAVPSVDLLDGVVVRSAAVAPLRAHGVTMGAVAVVDRRGGPFTTEDLWLLSTVATQASVVLANGRLFEMVRRSKDEWETAFNALAEGIAVVTPDDRIVRANRALAGLLHQPEEALLGTDLCDALFTDPEMARESLAAVRRGERPAPLILRSEPSGGRIVRITAAPLGEEPAAGAALVVLVEDVTDQQAMEAQLIQNEKMAAIGQLVSGVAHELNNPLTSIAGLTELLLERGTLPDTREHLRVVHEQAERASRIVRNLLTFARKGTPGKEPVDLNDVVTRTALLIVYELKLRGIELETRPAAEPVVVHGDRYELQQVLLNLVTNAAQAVSQLQPGLPRVVTVETELKNDLALLRVRDTGEGVPPALVPYLFTPFFTTKGPGHGTGLGLSLSYGLIESHGGRLSYAPAPRGGAEFTVALPAVTTPEMLPAPRRSPVPGAFAAAAAAAVENGTARGDEPQPAAGRTNGARAQRRVLVVDEDQGIHRLVSALFTPDGHAVEVTRSGENALRLTRQAEYDLIIADAAAAADGGRLFVPALVEEHPDWAGRIVTATGERAPGPADLFPGIPVHHVRKPFDLRDLRAIAADILSPDRSSD